MKKIKIYLSGSDSPNIGMLESGSVKVDLSNLRAFYAAMGEKHEKSVSKFIEYWESVGYESFFHPKAAIKLLSTEAAVENFGSQTLPLNDCTDKVAVAVWSIGEELEKEASVLMSSLGGIMTGFLLDVAGSIALYSMHEELLSWAKKNIALPEGKFINGECYPGMGSMRQDLMEKVVGLSDSKRLIGVDASGNSLLKPRKSQCSFITIGTLECETEIKSVRCVPCAGKKCLYYQLGGCHMMM